VTIDVSGILQILTAVTALVGGLAAGVVMVIRELRSVSRDVKAAGVKADANAMDLADRTDSVAATLTVKADDVAADLSNRSDERFVATSDKLAEAKAEIAELRQIVADMAKERRGPPA